MKVANFRKNTRYSAVKQLPETFAARVVVPAGTHPRGVVYSQTFTVPAGVYFENALIKTDLDSDFYPSNAITFSTDPNRPDETRFLAQVFQLNNRTYRFEVVAIGGLSGFYSASFGVEIKLRLAKTAF